MARLVHESNELSPDLVSRSVRNLMTTTRVHLNTFDQHISSGVFKPYVRPRSLLGGEVFNALPQSSKVQSCTQLEESLTASVLVAQACGKPGLLAAPILFEGIDRRRCFYQLNDLRAASCPIAIGGIRLSQQLAGASADASWPHTRFVGSRALRPATVPAGFPASGAPQSRAGQQAFNVGSTVGFSDRRGLGIHARLSRPSAVRPL